MAGRRSASGPSLVAAPSRNARVDPSPCERGRQSRHRSSPHGRRPPVPGATSGSGQAGPNGRADRPGSLPPTMLRCESSAPGHAPGQRAGKVRARRGQSGSTRPGAGLLAVVAIVVIVLFISSGIVQPQQRHDASASPQFQHDVAAGQVATANFDNTTGVDHRDSSRAAASYTTTGPLQLPHVGRQRAAAAPRSTTPSRRRARASSARSSSTSLAGRPDHRVLRLDEPPGPGTDVRDHVDRALAGQGLHDRAPAHDLRRRRRLSGRQAGDQRGRRLPQVPGPLPGDRRPSPEGRAARRAARAPARPCSRGRSPARPASRSSRSAARTSWRCSSASGRAASATCSRPPASRLRRSSSSTRSTRSAASAAPDSAAATTSGSRRSTRCCRRWTASTPPRASS